VQEVRKVWSTEVVKGFIGDEENLELDSLLYEPISDQCSCLDAPRADFFVSSCSLGKPAAHV